MTIKIFAAAVLWLTVLIGCESAGFIQIIEPDGTQIEVHQPGKSVAPATLVTGNTSASTGNRQPQTSAMIAAGHTWIAWIAGPALMLIGIGALAAKKWLPVIPTTLGTYTMAAGVAVIVLAIALPTIPTWVWAAAAIGAAALGLWLVVPGLISNFKRDRTPGGAPGTVRDRTSTLQGAT